MLILCSTPPHSNSFQPTSAKGGLPLILWTSSRHNCLSELEKAGGRSWKRFPKPLLLGLDLSSNYWADGRAVNTLLLHKHTTSTAPSAVDHTSENNQRVVPRSAEGKYLLPSVMRWGNLEDWVLCSKTLSQSRMGKSIFIEL